MCVRMLKVLGVRLLGIGLAMIPLLLLYGVYSLESISLEDLPKAPLNTEYALKPPTMGLEDALRGESVLPHWVEENSVKTQDKSLKQWEKEFLVYHPHRGVDMQIWCLARAVFYEARDQPERGRILVAQVVMNRVESKRFPSTPCEVVYQPSRDPKRPNACQYIFTCAPQKARIEDEPKAWDDAYRIAVKVYYKLDQGFWSRADHYHRDDVSPGWAEAMEYRGRVGRHLFYVAGGI